MKAIQTSSFELVPFWLRGMFHLRLSNHPVKMDDSSQQAQWWGPGSWSETSSGGWWPGPLQITKKVEAMTAPFQYALSTKAGCECVAHILQSMTDLDPDTTITSIERVGAYGLFSRNAMLEGLLQMDGGDQIIPFVRMFYGGPSTYIWEDEMGTTQYIPQGEGKEQGDPSPPLSPLPMLYALGQHGSLVATQERMIGNEKVFASLDDVYLASGPGGWSRCSPSSAKSFTTEPTSKCTMAKPRFGTDQGCCPAELRHSQEPRGW